ncbi:RraA family protein [Leptospira santarosai]|uniref:RraA family protein n=1 Tax=Leptospira santarosai TaxID=28183 RepID=UPI0002BD671E|nr:RraA family protein [Leptospira santarosai]EMO73409.1 demethylmenaquinone methyltransferase [Leptospira santarosai str. 200403458]EMO98228.1 demethylmenaquinone methyltransferase [Leptospira santarosai str. 200702252]
MNSLELLREFSTPLISDALDSLGINGGLEGIRPIDINSKIVGPAFTVQFAPVKENQQGKAADYLEEVPPGSVIVLENQGRTDCTVWGDILSKLSLNKKINGTVINGMGRDIAEILSIGYPLFVKGTYMKSGKGRTQMQSIQTSVVIGSTEINPGDILIGDASGVISIKKEMLNEVVSLCQKIDEMEKIILQECLAGMPLSKSREKHNYNKYSIIK